MRVSRVVKAKAKAITTQAESSEKPIRQRAASSSVCTRLCRLPASLSSKAFIASILAVIVANQCAGSTPKAPSSAFSLTTLRSAAVSVAARTAFSASSAPLSAAEATVRKLAR